MTSGFRLRWVAGLAIVLALLGVAWLLRPMPPRPQPFAPADHDAGLPSDRDLITLRNLGLGRLENHHYDQAIQAFEAILKVRPDEPFAVRNLAIAHVKHTMEQIDERTEPEAFAKGREVSRAAIQTLQQLEPKSGLPDFLQAVLATKSNDPRAVLLPLKSAVELDPQNVPWKFQWFELGRQLRGVEEKDQAFQAGMAAAKSAPDNLFVQKEVLAEALSRLAEAAKSDLAAAAAESEELSAWLESLRDPIRVLGVSVQVQAKVDLVTLLDEVVTALKEQNWTKARTEFFKIKNLLSQETASDADLIHPFPLAYHDPLNYVAWDFSPAFYQRSGSPDVTLPQIDVIWKEAEGVLPDGDPNIFALKCLDVDLDGLDDLVAQSPNNLTVYRREKDRAGWSELSLDMNGRYTSGFLSADLDDDVIDAATGKADVLSPVTPDKCHEADPDFVLYGTDGVLLVKNVRDETSQSRRLEAIPKEAAGFDKLTQVIDAQLVDFDHDGDLDLITLDLAGDAGLKLRFWLNLGNFSFREATDQSVMPANDFALLAVSAVDWDLDNDVDLLLSGDGTCGWIENLRHGRMRFHPLDGFWSSADQLLVAELDGEAGWDLVLSGSEGTRLVTTRIPLVGLPTLKSEQRIGSVTGVIPELFDFDNDGAIDLLGTNYSSGSLWRNDGHAVFSVQPTAATAISMVGEPVATWCDLDADGDLDLITASGGRLHLITNEGGNQNHWLEVRIRAQQVKANEQGASRRVNHYGIGSMVEVKAGTRYQAQIAKGQTTRFGLGTAEKADILRVLLTNGVPQNRIEPKANELVCERQVLQTSCPYLFTWNGSRYEFVTDLIWASPLGLNATQTELMPWREWEYIKIDGAKLQPQDGEYRLQITEELWEAAYFDHVRLIAVDHPADVQIYTNEKVGSAELAAPKIHTVRNRRSLSSARDQSGRDWESQLSARDEVYTRNFERKLAQGLCDEHSLELDLGPLDDPRRITLFLSGWIRPTDTNINVALDQNPDLPSPTGLALWTRDESGAWHEISPHVGFPNGKTKTIAIDVSGAFAPGDYRLRLVSNREFYWDEAFFTVDEEPAEFREIELSLIRADLHYRGVSRGILPAGDGPETYNYDELAAVPPWPAMDGMFTRYGDVQSLLVHGDDRLLVCGAGDELSLAYRVPDDSLPAGWVRDFVAYHVGWVKDCHLNTWEGERVEPLPFVKMRDHDYWSNRPEETGSYADYLRTYQTRRQVTPFRDFIQKFSAKSKAAIPAWERQRRTGD